MSRVQTLPLPGTAARGPTLELLILALPMMGMTISRMLMGFIDFAMVSKLGTAAQAAITPCTMLLFVIACVGMGMAQGVQTFVSQADGRGEPQRSGAYVWQTLYIAVAAFLLSAPVAYFVPLWFPLVAKLGGHPAEVQQMEIDFLRYGLWSIGPMAATAGLESFYNGIKRPMLPFISVLASLVTIAIGNWILIFGPHLHLTLWGFVLLDIHCPRMGIAGSGIATLLAWCVRLGILLIPLTSRAIDARYRTRGTFAFDVRKLLEIVRVGGPVAFQWLVDIGAWFVFLEFMMPPFGETVMAGTALSIQFMHLSFMPALGIGIAVTTQVGNAVGAGKPNLAEFRVRVARRVVVSYMAAMTLLFIFGGRGLATLLTFEQDPALRAAVIAAAAHALLWVGLFQISDALCIVYSFASRGAGDTRVPALLFAGCCWGIFVTGGYVLTRFVPSLGPNGPWAMCTLYIIVLGVLLWWRFHSRAWEKYRLFGKPPDAGEPAVTHA